MGDCFAPRLAVLMDPSRLRVLAFGAIAIAVATGGWLSSEVQKGRQRIANSRATIEMRSQRGGAPANMYYKLPCNAPGYKCESMSKGWHTLD